MYSKITKSDPDCKVYGLIPLMASSSPYQIGALNAESFCERVLRCAGHILTEGNTLLGDAKLEKLVILRMNRKFMEYMRENHKDLIKDKLNQQFGMSVVRLLAICSHSVPFPFRSRSVPLVCDAFPN